MAITADQWRALISLLWPTPQASGTLSLPCYGQHRRPMDTAMRRATALASLPDLAGSFLTGVGGAAHQRLGRYQPSMRLRHSRSMPSLRDDSGVSVSGTTSNTCFF